jgi:hypothetical protein
VGSLRVPVITLGQLAERFGVAAFLKIDAEGFDDHVIGGMSFRPGALTFEFNGEIPKVAGRCLQSSLLRSGYEFNYVFGMDMMFVSEKWILANSRTTLKNSTDKPSMETFSRAGQSRRRHKADPLFRSTEQTE